MTQPHICIGILISVQETKRKVRFTWLNKKNKEVHKKGRGTKNRKCVGVRFGEGVQKLDDSWCCWSQVSRRHPGTRAPERSEASQKETKKKSNPSAIQPARLSFIHSTTKVTFSVPSTKFYFRLVGNDTVTTVERCLAVRRKNSAIDKICRDTRLAEPNIYLWL